jgi:hypothetical protein
MSKKYSYQLKAGDLVRAHGGLFKVIEDAHEVAWHRPKYWSGSKGHIELMGPSDCAAALAICVEGEVPGYFKPGSEWVFKCNALAGQYTLAN